MNRRACVIVSIFLVVTMIGCHSGTETPEKSKGEPAQPDSLSKRQKEIITELRLRAAHAANSKALRKRELAASRLFSTAAL